MREFFADFWLWHWADRFRAPKIQIESFGRRLASRARLRKGVEKANYNGRGYYGMKLNEPTSAMADAKRRLGGSLTEWMAQRAG